MSFHKKRESSMLLNGSKKLLVFWCGGALDEVEGTEASNMNRSLYAMTEECMDGFDGKVTGGF